MDYHKKNARVSDEKRRQTVHKLWKLLYGPAPFYEKDRLRVAILYLKGRTRVRFIDFAHDKNGSDGFLVKFARKRKCFIYPEHVKKIKLKFWWKVGVA